MAPAGAAAEARLRGAADGEAADLLRGDKTGQGLDSLSPGRQEEEDGRMSSGGAWSFSSSSTSSLASDVESDDGDSGYPLTQCEYEEIPSFRWIASPLRWWKPKKKTRSKTNHKLRTRNISVALFDDHPAFKAKDLARAMSKVLGSGAYGSVHKLTLGDGHELCMRRLIGRANLAEDFEAQAQALGKIRHPNIVALRAYCTWPQAQKALVSDYMLRGSLSAFLQHSTEPADAISMPERMKMAIGIARGLHHLHARCNMVHGDLTSRNVLLDRDDDGHGVKIADYALIPHLPAAGGASEYRAPEAPDFEKPNVKTDVYSLGVIILELLTGNPPERAKDRRMPLWKAETKLRIALASTWCLAWRCMDRSPDARPEALDVLRQLEDITARSLGYRAIGRDIGGGSTTGDAARAGRSVAVKSSADGVAGSSPSTTAAAIPTTGLDEIASSNMAKKVTSKDSQGNQLEGAGQSTEEILMQAQYEGDAEAHARHSKDISPATRTEETSEESVAPDQVTSSPTTQLQGDQDASHELSGQDKSAESKRSIDGIADMSSGGGAGGITDPLSRIV